MDKFSAFKSVCENIKRPVVYLQDYQVNKQQDGKYFLDGKARLEAIGGRDHIRFNQYQEITLELARALAFEQGGSVWGKVAEINVRIKWGLEGMLIDNIDCSASVIVKNIKDAIFYFLHVDFLQKWKKVAHVDAKCVQ